MSEVVVVTEVVNDVVISSPGPQGPRGKTILNGFGVPSNNFGLQDDFYFDKNTSRLYGPKLSDITWENAPIVTLTSNTYSIYLFSETHLLTNIGSSNSIYISNLLRRKHIILYIYRDNTQNVYKIKRSY
jgi:hypothetical protein